MRIPISEIKINPGRREADPTHIDGPDFTDEQTETARIQANKLREAADRLTAQLEGRR